MSELTKEGEVLAVAVNVERVVADGQRVTFATAFAIDMTRAQKNKILDELMDLAARQAARSKRPVVLADLRKHREVLAQFQEDAARAEANWPLERSRLEAAIADAESDERAKAQLDELNGEIANAINVLQARRGEEFSAGLAEWRNTGRVADYKPRGHRETNLKRIDADIEKAKATAIAALEQLEVDRLTSIDAAKATLQKAEAERGVVIGNYEISVKRYSQAIEALEEELAEVDALLKD